MKFYGELIQWLVYLSTSRTMGTVLNAFYSGLQINKTCSSNKYHCDTSSNNNYKLQKSHHSWDAKPVQLPLKLLIYNKI
jgi:hypothetical protein